MADNFPFTEPAIMARELRRSFDGRPAVAGISLEVRSGEVFGILGPNGSGKTTTVRLLNGLISPDAGEMRVLGLDPVTQGDQVRRHTGVLTESPSLNEGLTVYDNLEFYGTLYGIPAATLPARIKSALERMGLTSRMLDKAGGLSKGMKQRLAIARAILHEPPVLFLDEPTSGLDPEAAEQINALILDLKRQGHTVFLCTHRLTEAERVCDRFAFFSQGHILATGTKAELEQRLDGGLRVELEFSEEIPASLGGTRDGQILQATVSHREEIADLVEAAVTAGGRVVRVSPLTPSLEDIYFTLQHRSEAPHELA
ncbi:Fluoroquinolones export ATP-binding protein [compost metagenome]